MSSPATVSPTAPGAIPVLGHALKLRNDPIGWFESLRAQGDVVRIKIGWQSAYVVTSTTVSHELFVAKYRSFDKGVAVEHFRDVFGQGLLSSDGELHRLHRLLLQPAFHRDRLAEYLTIMREQIAEQTDSWRAGQVLDARIAMTAITLGVVARAITSARVADELAAEVQQRLPRILDLSYRRAMSPLPVLNRLPLPRNREWTELVARLHPLVDRVIADYRRTDTRRPDLLSMMLDARDGGNTMSDSVIHDQIVTILLAGTETTATGLSWTFALLSAHPAVEQRVVAELAEVLGDRPVEHDDLARLDYTTRVIEESLRHSPPIWLITRRAIEEVELGAHRIPKGASVLLSPYLTGHDPALITDPEVFDPDRWTGERMTGAPRRAALPFGAGPRKCIGDSFAVTEIAVALATILRKWRLRVKPGTPITAEAGLTYFPRDLQLIVTPRVKEL
ncbi:cytochrome P450 [Nocardia sp. NPDC051570]|uniref:cytochrome P450 n=1 Tax=Nocardia sp. NPDC051570 TaxID=3364324 RepID=UPI00379E245A